MEVRWNMEVCYICRIFSQLQIRHPQRFQFYFFEYKFGFWDGGRRRRSSRPHCNPPVSNSKHEVPSFPKPLHSHLLLRLLTYLCFCCLQIRWWNTLYPGIAPCLPGCEVSSRNSVQSERVSAFRVRFCTQVHCRVVGRRQALRSQLLRRLLRAPCRRGGSYSKFVDYLLTWRVLIKIWLVLCLTSIIWNVDGVQSDVYCVYFSMKLGPNVAQLPLLDWFCCYMPRINDGFVLIFHCRVVWLWNTKLWFCGTSSIRNFRRCVFHSKSGWHFRMTHLIMASIPWLCRW